MRKQLAKMAADVLIVGVVAVAVAGCSESSPPTNGGTAPKTISPPPPAPAAVSQQPPSRSGAADMPELSAADAVKIDEQFAAAQLLFDNNGCNRCHSLDASEAAFAGGPPPNGPPPGSPPGDFGPGGPGPGGPPRGPNLSHIAQNPEHTQVWIADHIRDPKSHNPRSRMPSFEGKMTDEEINQIAEYLASLK